MFSDSSTLDFIALVNVNITSSTKDSHLNHQTSIVRLNHTQKTYLSFRWYMNMTAEVSGTLLFPTCLKAFTPCFDRLLVFLPLPVKGTMSLVRRI